jgi:tetratricopeptide (TPR) repeat protein
LLISLGVLSPLPQTARADLVTCSDKLIKGDYAAVIEESTRAIDEGQFSEQWRLLNLQARLALGDFDQARTTLESALTRFQSSIRLRLLGHAIYQSSGDGERARLMLEQINALVSARPWWYSDALDLVAQGRAALLMGEDPRRVLELVYDKARRESPGTREVWLAPADLALDKNDFAEAGKLLSEAVKRFPNDPDIHFGLARAFASSDGAKAQAALTRTLALNPNHIPALLMLVDDLIDGENPREAEEVLAKVLAISPSHPAAWSYSAVLAHLENDAAGEALSRSRAFRWWKENPAVDHLIGRKLSQKYRFAEGAVHQRAALKLDPSHLPAKAQLAQDLLRLGEVEEGWKLAREVLEKDAYDVVAFNLVTLQDNIAKFRTLEDAHFIVRMESREADIYGDRVLSLLNRARTTLCDKYGMELKERITVEIFPDQKDFAIRTFGLPGGAGFLGVCFGKVITANSPASYGGNSSWEAVLWHEFCHVVTLSATRNRMPRWLSEGISVYEERQADRTWGQSMTPAFRKMILDGEVTPVGQLSMAFLRARTPMHVQFAYYESSLVVEFLIQRAGADGLKRILSDLHEGVYINAAIERHVGPIKQIEADFEAHLKRLAEQMAPKADWTPFTTPTPPAGGALVAWLKAHPDSVHGLMLRAQELMNADKWEEAKSPLQRAIELYPQDRSDSNASWLLALAHRALKETDAERAALEKVAAVSADHVPAFLRLMELAAERKDWPTVIAFGERLLAVNPLSPQPHRLLAAAADHLNDHPRATRALRTLLFMEPPDPAQTHYDLARHLHAMNDPAARRHVLMALEEAPRFRDAQKLLLKLAETKEAEKPQEVKPRAAPN